MNISRLIASLSSALLTLTYARGQGTFENLNFELGNPGSGNSGTEVPVANALPFWTVDYGSVQQTQVGYNVVTSGSTSVSLVSGASVIDGNYSVLLQGGVTASGATISQTGTIPSGTESLLFKAQAGIGPLDVLVGTQSVPISIVTNGANYTLYGANISAWAGDSEQLTFSAASVGLNIWEIDDISFSPTATPEPNTLALLLMGGAALAARRWRANRS